MVSEATLKAIVEYGIFCSRHGAGQPVLTTVGAALIAAIEAECEAAREKEHRITALCRDPVFQKWLYARSNPSPKGFPSDFRGWTENTIRYHCRVKYLRELLLEPLATARADALIAKYEASHDR